MMMMNRWQEPQNFLLLLLDSLSISFSSSARADQTRFVADDHLVHFVADDHLVHFVADHH